eukprot:Phypoly_transcript_19374.p1 GENE.Phypoly_transcript_19374~~Phypoly_transcript_19374.p1  ORF type:complete len:237 (-),score=33.05 Phypoly_transcript_19374:15-626(-)
MTSTEARMSAIEEARKAKSVVKNSSDLSFSNQVYSANDRLIAEIRNLRPNSAKRLEAVAEVEKTMKTDVQRKQFLNPLMQEINKIKPISEQRAAAVEKVEQLRNERKVTPHFTLQTHQKVTSTELSGAIDGLKKVGRLDELDVKLTKINQENYRRMKGMSSKQEESEPIQKLATNTLTTSKHASYTPTTLLAVCLPIYTIISR